MTRAHEPEAHEAEAHQPITPGEILLREFLEPLGITQYRLGQATGLPQTRISEIVRSKRSITSDTALRLWSALDGRLRHGSNICTIQVSAHTGEALDSGGRD